MAEELQSLLEKINTEGVKKAQSEREKIIQAAKAEAKEIRAAAEADAAAMKKSAAENAESLQKRAESAIRQAARDILLELEKELEARIRKAVAGAADEALTPDFMASIVRDLASKFAENPDAEITVLSAVKDVTALENALSAALKNSFHSSPKVLGDSGIKGGMEVSFKDGELYFDFTENAVLDLIGAYVGSRLTALLKDK